MRWDLNLGNRREIGEMAYQPSPPTPSIFGQLWELKIVYFQVCLLAQRPSTADMSSQTRNLISASFCSQYLRFEILLLKETAANET